MNSRSSNNSTTSEEEKCPYCGGSMLHHPFRLLTSNGYVTVYDQAYCNCPDAVAARESALQLNEEQERKKRLLNREFAYRQKCLSSGIPLRFLDVEPNDEYESELKNNGFYIYGPVRAGKTTLAVSIAKSCIRHGQTVVFTTFSQISLHLRSTFSGTSTKSEEDLLGKYLTCDCLVIDDLGHESLTDYAIERLMTIIGERYNNLLPVIITSQYSPSDLGRKISLRNTQTALAVTRRLKDYCRYIDLGPSIRR